MKRQYIALIVGIVVFSFTSSIFAANTNAGVQNSGTGQQVPVVTKTVTVVSTDKQIQNQNVVQTQNQGEDQSLQVAPQEQEGTTPAGQSLIGKMNAVTANTDSILNTTMAKGSPGEKIQEIIQTQATAQKEITTEVQKLDSRNGFVKFLLGSDAKALQVLTQQREQNQLRILELEQLKNQLVNQGDITMVQETIQALTEQNTALQDRINLEKRSTGMFGWLIILFTQ